MPVSFAYVFERFPSFTQTFCAREVQELRNQGVEVAIYSIRSVSDEAVRHFPAELLAATTVLPSSDEIRSEVNALKEVNRLPQAVVLTLREWGERPDKMRIYEAAWIGYQLREQGVRHVHTHFAGLGARTCWWLRRFYGFTYSFTGHANDLFCPDEATGVTLAMLMRDAAVVVAVSDFTARWLRERFPRACVTRVYNGMDIAATERLAAAEAKQMPPTILSVGRLIEKKGFADLIAACAVLRDRQLVFRCEIIGEGPLEEGLRKQIADLRLEDRVVLVGPLPQDEVSLRLGQAMIFALACVVEADGGMDVLPTVLMEAMAARLPCVSTQLAGVPEMVVDAETGMLVAPHDVAAIARSLERYLTLPHEAAAHGQAGYRLAVERFSQSVTARHLLRTLLARGLVHLPPGAASDLWRARLTGLWRRSRLARVPRASSIEIA
jgi:colanic acid/amylovoran biosynthesis glycosyltransferase